MSLPPFAPIPPVNIRLHLAPEEWEACLDAWLTLSELTLRLSTKDFDSSAGDHGTLSIFLTSLYQELDKAVPGDTTFTSSKAIALKRIGFRLASRALSDSKAVSKLLLTWNFLSCFCHVHIRTSALQQLMNSLWKSKSGVILPILQKQKDLLVKLLESKNTADSMPDLNQLAPMMHASADVGVFFMTGSDFLDSLLGAYGRTVSEDQKKAISTIVYLGLCACLRSDPPNFSLLSDHLYSLKSQADQSNSSSALLADVVTNTPLITRLRQSLSGKAPDRLSKLFDTLETYRTPSLARLGKNARRARPKGKGKQMHSDASFNVHRVSLISQVQDLFPDLGTGFILKLLDEYEDNVEQVIAHLLDNSLPDHLASLDRTEEAPVYDSNEQSQIDNLAPRSTPPPSLPQPYIPERRNVFDDDDLDRLEFGASRLHIGKQDRTASSSDHPNKAAILSALAAFDSDDDERDDTYDVEDVGGTIDTSHPDGEPGPAAARVTQEQNDMALFTTYRTSPELFARTFDVRKGQARQALKAETGLTDEAIEGWAIMLQRDPKRLRRLEAQLASFDGKQSELASTAYRGSETEDSDAPGRGGFRGRGGRSRGGRGGGGRGGSGNVGDAANSAQSQRRKEANKSSRANHSRRDQRARKMARGGFAG